jgi:hypothetical protein
MLKVLKPLSIKDAMLQSSSVPETDYAEWVSGAAYSLGARVILLSTHRIYQCIVAVTGATTPTSDTAHWVEVGPTNRWAMFDSKVSTATVGTAAGLQVVLKPGRCNGLALLELAGIAACSVTCTYPVTAQGTRGALTVTTRIYSFGVELTTTTDTRGEAGTLVGSVTLAYSIQLQNRNVSDWTGYFLEPFVVKTDVFVGFPSRSDMTVTLDIASALPKIGALMIGNFVELGDSGYGVSSSIDDYSVVQTDEWGVSKLVERDYVKRVNYPVTVENWAMRRAFSTLSSLRATPAVFIGSDDYRYTPFTVFGRVARFNVSLSFATYSIVNVEVQGLSL